MTALPSLIALAQTAVDNQPLQPLEQVFCYTDSQQAQEHYSWADFYAHRNAWRQVFLQSDATHVALYNHSAFDFISALSALWQCKKIAVIPGNNNAETVQSLKTHCTLFAGEFQSVDAISPEQVTPLTSASENSNTTVSTDDTAIIIFTSGSSGQPLPIHKCFHQLNAELSSLEYLWGSEVSGTTVTGSVSHQHIYGLLFRILWPALSGRAFVDIARSYSESLLSDCDLYGDISAIMSPAHLSRLPSHLATPTLHARCKNVFSSGAPLTAEAAQDTRNILQRDAIEVYGSSETGGVAYRQQRLQTRWQTMPNVEVKRQTKGETQHLCIRSPHLNNNDWFISADQVDSINNAGFTLGKRVDRIAKIGGKRVSLTSIEEKIAEHPWVQDVRVITLEARAGRSAALVVLNSEGNNQLINSGKRHLNNTLTQLLEGVIERTAQPRYFRYWDSIPYNQQGKTTQADIAALFSSDKPEYPTLIAPESSDDSDTTSTVLNLFIPHNLSWFDGHFPGRPILPGVVQTHWANHYAHQYFKDLGQFSHLEMIKFQQVISPGTNAQLTLSWNSDKAKLSFSYRQGETRLSSGRIAFTPVTSSSEV